MKKKLSNITLCVLKKKQITNNIKKKLLLLKSQHYKYSLLKQRTWFNKNINDQDFHNLLFYKNTLIGYNCLRKCKLSLIRNKKNYRINFFLFDTLVVKKNFRNKGLSKLIMESSNEIISRKKNLGLLFCEKKMIKYYSKFKWKLIKKRKILSKRSKILSSMIFNFENKKFKSIILEDL